MHHESLSCEALACSAGSRAVCHALACAASSQSGAAKEAIYDLVSLLLEMYVGYMLCPAQFLYCAIL